MYEILALFLFVIAVVFVAYIFYLKRERSVLLREIEVRVEEHAWNVPQSFGILVATRILVAKATPFGVRAHIG